MPRKARRRAWGSVTEAARGKKYVLRWVENTPRGRRRRSRTVYGTYREACNELAKIQATKCDERAVPTIDSLFEARYLPWLERRYEGSASNTKSLYLRAWKNHCEPKWARVPIDQVKPLDVQEWLDGMAYGNAHSALIVMRRTLDFAVNLEQIPSNPFRRDYEMPAKGSARSKEVYGLAQAAEMLAKVEGMPYEAAYILAAFGGCRTGESLGVRVEDVREIRAGGVRFAAVAVKRQAGTPERGDSRWHEDRAERAGDPGARAVLLHSAQAARRARGGRPGVVERGRRKADRHGHARLSLAQGRRHPLREPPQLVAHLRAVRMGRRVQHARTAHGPQDSRRDGAALSAPVDRAARRGLRSVLCQRMRALGIFWDMSSDNRRSERS